MHRRFFSRYRRHHNHLARIKAIYVTHNFLFCTHKPTDFNVRLWEKKKKKCDGEETHNTELIEKWNKGEWNV